MGYYDAPTDSIFQDIKENSIKLWQTYDNEYGYVDEKVNYIKDMQNIKDNGMTMVAMFDYLNIAKLLNMVTEETKQFITKNMEGQL